MNNWPQELQQIVSEIDQQIAPQLSKIDDNILLTKIRSYKPLRIKQLLKLT